MVGACAYFVSTRVTNIFKIAFPAVSSLLLRLASLDPRLNGVQSLDIGSIAHHIVR